MKKLESLNNSLFEKFEGKKVNNLALCLGGEKYTTHPTGGGTDTFDTKTPGGATMYLPGGKVVHGDCNNASTAGPGPVSGGGGNGVGGGGAIGGGFGGY